MLSPLLPRDIEAWLRLSYAALPTARTRGLLRTFASPQLLLEAAFDEGKNLREEWGLTEKAIAKLRVAARQDVSKAMDAMQQHGIHIVTESEYPPLLQQVGDDTPPFLFVRGAFDSTDYKAIAIVGTRNLTEYGRGVAHKFALELGRAGWTVVSGLARGIDTAAHRGALDGGGRTIAVTACGLDIVYPSENRDLMLEIEGQGAVISEWAPSTQPATWHFPARNRIIAGLSHGIIVVEASAKSGALITANFAAEFDRPVFAVPGNLHKPQSRGPHLLIKEGANLIENIEDVISFLGGEVESLGTPESEAQVPEILDSHTPSKGTTITPPRRRPPSAGSGASVNSSRGEAEPKPASSRPAIAPQVADASPVPVSPPAPRPDLSPNESKVWLCLDVEPRHLDDIAGDADLPMSGANAALVLLEIKGAAKRLPGNLFVRVV